MFDMKRIKNGFSNEVKNFFWQNESKWDKIGLLPIQGNIRRLVEILKVLFCIEIPQVN